MQTKLLTIGSLFSGIGGLELGLEWTGGFQTVWQVEKDVYCQRILAKHWPNCGRWDDVRTFPPHPQKDWQCDILVGGDPCQENSRARFANHTTEPSLGGEFIRVVDVLRPWLVLRENPSSPRTDAPWPWWRFRASLESLGYACVPFRLRACCVGACHVRERLFLFCERADTQGKRLEGRNIQGTDGRRKPIRVEALVDAENWLSLHRPRGYRTRDGIPGGMDRLRCLGNAVVPQVGQFIGECILNAIGTS